MPADFQKRSRSYCRALRSTPTATAASAENPQQTVKPTPSSQTPDIRSLVERANQAFVDYRRLTSEGKLAEAGAKLDDLKAALEQLNR